MIFKGETNCEKCIHKKVCSAKNQQDFLDAKRGIEKLGETISDILRPLSGVRSSEKMLLLEHRLEVIND